MRAALLGLLLATVGLSGPAYAQELFPLQQVPPVVVSGCTPAGSPCPVGGPPVPAGMHWNLVADGEFTQYPNSGYPTFWTANGSTLPDGTLCGVTFDPNNGAVIDGSASCNAQLGYESYLASPVSPYGTTTVWRYGYFEISAKQPFCCMPSYGFAPHSDFYFRTYPTSASEDDINEAYHQVDTHYTSHGVHETVNDGGNGFDGFLYPGTTRLDQSFNTYGLAWMDDGSAHGSQQLFFDGLAQENPYQFQSSTWDGGVKVILRSDWSEIYDPFYVQYIRIWQLAPN